MRWRKLCLSLLLLCGSISALPAPAALAGTPGARPQLSVMLVQSYHQEYSWCQLVAKGVRNALRDLPVRIEVQYLDAKRDPDPERLRAKAKALFDRIEAEKPQVVIAADDAAQYYLVAPYLKGRAAPQVIFCGVNAQPAHYGFPAANVSGVRERWHFREGFALLKRINPRLHTVTLLSDTSESSDFVLKGMREEAKAGRFALNVVEVERPRTLQQWRLAVRRAQARTDALALGLYLTLVDEKTGKVAEADEVAAWNMANIHRPTLGFADYASGHGLLCGILESGEEQGQLAGAMARTVLEHGVAAGSLPLRINRKGLVLLNLKTAERLNLIIPYNIIQAAEIVIK
ncbi:MAG: hypothetical protein AUJ49_11695 [Desulfovibrionaceae bacterium CG1_02_65_16]|nr:MAG: hypothetical protein AUJ49_11695 [Desulfovibrionaceae bacterium CG1_02_65_16]